MLMYRHRTDLDFMRYKWRLRVQIGLALYGPGNLWCPYNRGDITLQLAQAEYPQYEWRDVPEPHA